MYYLNLGKYSFTHEMHAKKDTFARHEGSCTRPFFFFSLKIVTHEEKNGHCFQIVNNRKQDCPSWGTGRTDEVSIVGMCALCLQVPIRLKSTGKILKTIMAQ